MALSPQDVRHVANLAQLALDEQQIIDYAPQLDHILAYAAQISEVPGIDDVPPTVTPFAKHNVWREDSLVHPPLSVEDVLSNAPNALENQFHVPKIIGEN